MSNAPGPLPPEGSVAVIFVAMRTPEDEAGYAQTADRIADLAAKQPGRERWYSSCRLIVTRVGRGYGWRKSD